MTDLTKADMHNHSWYSLLRVPKLRGEHYYPDSVNSPKLLIKAARKRKIGAIALTDHDTMRGIKPFLHYASKYNDIIPIVGQEITKYNQKRKGWAHVLVYGLKEIPWKIRFQPLPEFLEYLEENNGLYVLAHPFDLSQSAPGGGFNQKTFEINFSVLKRFRMVEIVNGLQSKRHNYLTQIIARELGIPGIAGGDSHYPNMIGRCFSYVEGTTEEEILEYLRKVKRSPSAYRIRTHGTGSNQQIWAEWFFYLFHNLELKIRYDIYRHLNPGTRKKDHAPVYDELYYKSPTFVKILVQASIPYAFWASLAFLKIWSPRMEKQTREKELKVLKSLIDYQAINENLEIPHIDLPFTVEDILFLQQQ